MAISSLYVSIYIEVIFAMIKEPQDQCITIS